MLLTVLSDTTQQIERFTSDEPYYKNFRKAIEQQMNENFVSSIKTSPEQMGGRRICSHASRPFSPYD
jgi:hypothetical protein